MEFLKVGIVILLYFAVLGFGIMCARLMDRRELSHAPENRRCNSADSMKEHFHG